MAKLSMRERSKKKEQLVEKYRERRMDLKERIRKEADPAEVYALQQKLAKLPVNSNKVRLNTRCNQCGRAHAVYRKFALCRICLRQQLMTGNVTGGRKSSW